MGRNIPEVLHIQKGYFYILLVFKMQRHVGLQKFMQSKLEGPKRGNTENLNVGIIME